MRHLRRSARNAPISGSVAALAVCLAASTLLATPAVAADPPPSSMASMGDSITRGFNASGWFSDWPSRSWTTGTTSSVKSHYSRILAKNSAISGKNFNDAVSGAKAADMPGQANNVANRNVQYVTILIGANDACTGSEASMTSVAAYRASIDSALSTLKTRLPTAKVALISVPDIKQLWFVLKGNSSARSAWSTFGICQSMLANPTSTAQADEDRRNRVRQRVIDFNTQLAAACAAYGANCDFDDNAVFNYPFAASQVSTWDYFHPNVAGQTILAEKTYLAGFNW